MVVKNTQYGSGLSLMLLLSSCLWVTHSGKGEEKSVGYWIDQMRADSFELRKKAAEQLRNRPLEVREYCLKVMKRPMKKDRW